MEKPKMHISERSPELAKALDFFYKQLEGITLDAPEEERIRVVEEYQTIANLCSLDLLLEMHTYYRVPTNDAKSITMRALTDLTDLARKYEILRNSLRGYLPRLEQLSKRDGNLAEVYEAYRQVFGGNLK
jgi:hypothetical protein